MTWRKTKLGAGRFLLASGFVTACGTQPAPPAQEAAASTPVAAPTATPPAPPETSLGRLVRAERGDKAPLSVLCQSGSGRAFLGVMVDNRKGKKSDNPLTTKSAGGGKSVFVVEPGIEVSNSNLSETGLELCAQSGPARAQKAFVILSFEGARSRGVNEAGEMSEFMNFSAVSASNLLARVEGQSWLGDSAGRKYSRPGVVAGKDRTQLAFEVPADATGLVWHDGKKRSFELEPHPRETVDPAAHGAAKAESR